MIWRNYQIDEESITCSLPPEIMALKSKNVVKRAPPPRTLLCRELNSYIPLPGYLDQGLLILMAPFLCRDQNVITMAFPTRKKNNLIMVPVSSYPTPKKKISYQTSPTKIVHHRHWHVPGTKQDMVHSHSFWNSLKLPFPYPDRY